MIGPDELFSKMDTLLTSTLDAEMAEAIDTVARLPPCLRSSWAAT